MISAMQAPVYCSANSMEVKDRVITMLSSSAGSRARVLVAICCSGCSAVQVTPRVRMFFSPSSSSAARKASDVRPDREITTAATSLEPASVRSGNSSSSEAGTARARKPVITLHDAAAASAM